MNPKSILAIYLLVGLLPITHAKRIQWSAEAGGNDHWYEVICEERPLSWFYAYNQSIQKGGYLACITSSQECAFVWSLLSTNTAAWSSDATNGQKPGPYLGGYQKLGSDEPSGGWQWVTGEAFIFENWNDEEPNNTSGGTEDKIQYRWTDTNSPAGWNDSVDFSRADVLSYIVEYDYISNSTSAPNISTAVEISWSSTSEVSRVEFSENLQTNAWLNLDRPIETNTNGYTVFDSTKNGKKRFYRVISK